jgi:hypothetical protein
MSKRQIIVDGEVKLVSFSEWQKHTETKSRPRKAKLSVDKIQVESDPVQLDESNNQDQNNSEE